LLRAGAIDALAVARLALHRRVGGVCVVWSFVYLAVRNLFALALLVGRSERSKELEILVLHHELAVLRVGCANSVACSK
jgi:hypothetical protein